MSGATGIPAEIYEEHELEKEKKNSNPILPTKCPFSFRQIWPDRKHMINRKYIETDFQDENLDYYTWRDLFKSINPEITNSWEPKGEPKLYFVAIEGTHGIGKSTILSKLKDLGYYVLEEDFGKTYKSERGLTKWHLFSQELAWIGKRFEKIENICLNNVYSKDDIVFLDRSFLTPLIYSAISKVNKFMFGNICLEIMTKLEDLYGVSFKIIKIDRDCTLGDQMFVIKSRLIDEPWRKLYHEDDRDWLICCESGYIDYSRFIDRRIELKNYGEVSVEEEALYIINQTLRMLGKIKPKYDYEEEEEEENEGSD